MSYIYMSEDPQRHGCFLIIIFCEYIHVCTVVEVIGLIKSK